MPYRIHMVKPLSHSSSVVVWDEVVVWADLDLFPGFKIVGMNARSAQTSRWRTRVDDEGRVEVDGVT